MDKQACCSFARSNYSSRGARMVNIHSEELCKVDWERLPRYVQYLKSMGIALNQSLGGVFEHFSRKYGNAFQLEVLNQRLVRTVFLFSCLLLIYSGRDFRTRAYKGAAAPYILHQHMLRRRITGRFCHPF